MEHLGLIIFFVVIIISLLVILEFGFRLGVFSQKHHPQEYEASGNLMIQSVLGLVAFMLAFTFGVAGERFNDRRVLIIEEANAISTAYLQAGFLPEDSKQEVKELLRQYVDLRIAAKPSRAYFEKALAESNRIQARLWNITETIGKEHLDSDVASLFVQSMSEMLSLQSKRVAAGLYARIPESMWLALFLITSLGIAGIGYQTGLSGKRKWLDGLALILSFTIILTIIGDLDRPMEGFLKASRQPLFDLSKKIGHAQGYQDKSQE